MIGLRRAASAVVLAAVAASPCNVALARGHAGSPASTFAPAYLDSDRCRVLTEQLDAALARLHPEYGDNVAKLVDRGAALCTAGYFAAGADELERAVRMISETPAKPRPVTRLR